MADSRKDTRSKEEKSFALTYLDEKPVWDFSADLVAYALGMAGNTVLVPVLRQHTNPEEKRGFFTENAAALRLAASGIKVKGDDMEIPEPNEKPLRDFIDLHFEFLFGVSSSDVDVHKAFLDENPYIKSRIFREGVDGVQGSDEEEEVKSNFIFDIMSPNRERDVDTQQILFSIERNRAERVVLTHKMAEVTDAIYREYKGATTRKVQARTRKVFAMEDYNVLSNVYNKLVISISGAVVDKKPCSNDNKKEWVDLVPLGQKLSVLTALMREIEGKNAL